MKLMTEKTVQSIVDNCLCTGCGACAGICPAHVIEMKTNCSGYLYAAVDSRLCILCGKCAKVCPSNPDNEYSTEIDHLRIGKNIAGYVGYATEPVIRNMSQSGGVVTALLCYLLERGDIEGAIVNNLNEKTARPECTLATSKEAIIDAAGSYYSQSPVVKTILEHTDKKTAAVVLGCQAESLHFIRKKYPKITLPEYTIGLICAGQNSGYMIDDLIEQMGYDMEDKDRFRFRFRFRFKYKPCGGWPGDIYLSASNREYRLPKERRHALKQVYELHRCIPCFDKMNAFCDIGCGDP